MPENKKKKKKVVNKKETKKELKKESKNESKNEPKKAQENNKLIEQKGKKNKTKKRKKHPKLMMFFKICIIMFLLLCVIGAGIVAGIFFGLFGNDFEITKEELKIGASNSVIVDKNGAVIANLSGDEKRKIITLGDMSDYLPKAYVAIEDERFYKHSGVDFKRTGGAIFKKLIGKGSFGGSTITQQLVKNITKDDETAGMAGIFRKVKEWAKAYQVERMISKDQILELYLNILFVGSNNLHGVELGAEYYFNKSAKDLDLAECAYLAGINSSPNAYDPFDSTVNNTEKIKNKTLTVLGKMKELGLIEKEEDYNAAVAKTEAGLPFSQGVVGRGGVVYSYHTDAVIEQAINQVMEEKQISRQLAENYVYSSGLKIYSTVDNNIQSILDEEYKKSKYIINSPSRKQKSQSGMAIIDYKTGNVVGVAGGLGEKNEVSGWNRATQMVKQTGSSIKPIVSVAPGIQEKVITAATVYDDTITEFGGNYHPKDYNTPRGLINIRQFIETSQNVPSVKIMKELTPKKALSYLKQMGVSSLDDTKDDVLAISLGGFTNGISPLEMAAAYGTIANDGVYITPTFYTKIEDSSGNVVLMPKQESRRVFSEQNAYIVKTIIQEPVNGAGGTARICAISGMDVAAKTGTTNNDYDRWLCGFTPYYAGATWFGYDDNEEVFYSGNPAAKIWSAVMKSVHKGLPGARFTKPAGIVTATVCRTTGCLASSGCTSTYQEKFTSDNMPIRCEGHGSQEICEESKLLATEYCPSKKINVYGVAVPKERLKLWKPIGKNNATGKKITEECNVHKKPEEPKPEENKTNTNANANANASKNNNAVNNTNKNNNTNNNPKKPTTGTGDSSKPGGTPKPNSGTGTGASSSGGTAPKKNP